MLSADFVGFLLRPNIRSLLLIEKIIPLPSEFYKLKVLHMGEILYFGEK